MKRLIALSSVVVLAACGSEAPPPAAEPTEEVAEAPTAIDGGPLAGSYSTVDAEGNEAVWTLFEDGTFSLAAEGMDPVTGTFTSEDTEFCADPSGDDEGESCWTLTEPGEDGSWTATAEDGSVLTVTRGGGDRSEESDLAT